MHPNGDFYIVKSANATSINSDNVQLRMSENALHSKYAANTGIAHKGLRAVSVSAQFSYDMWFVMWL